MLTTSDFTVGALATLTPRGKLEDRVSTVSGDGVVRADGDTVWQLNRGSADTVRRYDAGALCRPEWEVALQRGANPHDALEADGAVWVALYDRNEIARLDAVTGETLASVDLTELALDGQLVGADRFERVGDDVVLALQRFDRTQTPRWGPMPGLIALFGSDGSLLGQTEVGPSPRMVRHPMDPDRVLVATGVYGEPDGQVISLDPTTGASEVLIDEQDLGRDIEGQGLVPIGEHLVLLTADFTLNATEEDPPSDAAAAIVCVDLRSGTSKAGPVEAGWFIDGAAVGSTAWVGLRRGWGPPGTPGLLPLDPVDCSVAGDRVETSLEPYSLTSVSGDSDES